MLRHRPHKRAGSGAGRLRKEEAAPYCHEEVHPEDREGVSLRDAIGRDEGGTNATRGTEAALEVSEHVAERQEDLTGETGVLSKGKKKRMERGRRSKALAQSRRAPQQGEPPESASSS